MSDTHFLRFDGVSRPVAISNGPKLLDSLSDVFTTWPYEIIEPENCQEEPIITVKCKDGIYRLRSPWLVGNPKTSHEIDAACAMVVDLVAAHLDDHPNQFCFHAGAVEFHGHLIVFPNRYRAGKSLLCAALAGRGLRIFADDILKAAPGRPGDAVKGLATGVAPRLRLPLPNGLSGPAHRFFEQKSGSASARYLYLDLDDHELASYNTALPIGGFVLLEREEGASASLEPVESNDMLRRVVWQNFARGQRAEDILQHLRVLVEGSLKFRLRYDDLDEAAALLVQELTSDRMQNPFLRQIAFQEKNDEPPAVYFRPDPSSDWLQKVPGISEQIVSGDCFLADTSGQAIHHLNVTGAMIWRLHSSPVQRSEVLEIMQVAFPTVDSGQLEMDVGSVVDDLLSKKLLRGVDPDVPEESWSEAVAGPVEREIGDGV
ncbi:MAG: PqqD family peptide modification chaperone [Hyphomicrobiaceae bacterium]